MENDKKDTGVSNTPNTVTQSEEFKVEKIEDRKPEQQLEKKTPLGLQEKSDFLDPIVWSQMGVMASTFKKSGALPASENEFTLMMKFQAGREMGMTQMESIKSFYFVNGNMNIFGSALMKRLRFFGWSITYKDSPNKCVVTVKKLKDDKTGEYETFTDSLTFEEAEQSGWTKSRTGEVKDNWLPGANRKMKLRYGAVSMLIKSYIPEVLGSATDIAEVATDYADRGSINIPNVEGSDEPAEESQLKTLEVLGADMTRTYTKSEAVQMMATLAPMKGKK